MRTTTIRLDETGEATFDAGGRAVVSLGPGRHSEVWIPSIATVSTSTGILDVAECRLWLGSPDAGPLIDATATGGQDSTDLPGVTLRTGQRLTAVWTGGTPGAVAHLSLTGERQITGR